MEADPFLDGWQAPVPWKHQIFLNMQKESYDRRIREIQDNLFEDVEDEEERVGSKARDASQSQVDITFASLETVFQLPDGAIRGRDGTDSPSFAADQGNATSLAELQQTTSPGWYDEAAIIRRMKAATAASQTLQTTFAMIFNFTSLLRKLHSLSTCH